MMKLFSRIFSSSEEGRVHRAKVGVDNRGKNVYIHEKMDKSGSTRGEHSGHEVNFETGTSKDFWTGEKR